MFATTHGMLWLKGKPGAGKSTLMKESLLRLKRTAEGKDIIIAFFFNSRGSELEKPPIGFYRSILHDLMLQDRQSLGNLL
jgi:ABC-type ATPase involved in cell division